MEIDYSLKGKSERIKYYICLLKTLSDLRSHPKWCSYRSIPMVPGAGQLCRHTKIYQFNSTFSSQQDVISFYIKRDSFVVMQMWKSHWCFM